MQLNFKNIMILILVSNSVNCFPAVNCQNPDQRFFGAERVLEWTIQGDFSHINDPNILLYEKEKAVTKGELLISDSALRFPVKIAARGAFRFEECPLRPFNLELADAKLKGEFPFIKSFSKLKLVAVCDPKLAYREEENLKLLKEYVAYKMLNHLSGPHLQVQLVRLKLLDPQGNIEYEGFSFLRETEESLGKRCEMKKRKPIVKKWDYENKISVKYLMNKDRTLSPYHYIVDQESLLRLHFSNRLLGNTDYDVGLDHNIIPLVLNNPNDLREYNIPYDFDLAQMVGGTYYGYAKTSNELAVELKQWIHNDQFVISEFRTLILKEYFQALPSMKMEIANSPLAKKGKKDLLNWIETFENVFKE